MAHVSIAFRPCMRLAVSVVTAVGLSVASIAAEPVREHPRLFFSVGDVPRLREQARTTHARLATNILRQADAILAKPVPPYPEQVGYEAFTQPTELPIPVALAWVLTGERKYLDRTREMLVSFARWPHWGNERQVGQRDYALAWMLRACAVAYDWTYPELSEEDRRLVREALGRHAQEVYEAATVPKYNNLWQNWWRTSYAQNHWHHCVFPLGLAALVLEGEDERAGQWLEFSERSMRLVSEMLEGIGDGTWHEGPHYQDGMLGTIVPLYLNMRRLKGIDLLDEGYMRSYALWRVYNHVPGVPRAALMRYSSFVPQWGGAITGGGHATLRYIASRYGDGRAQWLADAIAAKEPGMTSPLEFFYYDATVAATPPQGLSLDRTFPDLAGVIWRTGWGDDDLAFGLKTSAYGGRWIYEHVISRKTPFDAAMGGSLNAGHDHADANTFSLFWGRMELAGEMPDRIVIGQEGGIGNKTEAHNTLLVDGRGQLHPGASGGRVAEGTDGRLEVVCGAGGSSYLVADATNRYRDVPREGPPGELWLREFRRHVLFDKPRYLVIVDSVRSDAAHEYDWLCHLVDDAPTDRVTVEDGWVRSPAGETRTGRPWSDPPANDARMLGIRVVAPEGFRHEIGVSRYFTTFRTPLHKTYVKLRPPQATGDVRFVTVLWPTKTEAWDQRPRIELPTDTVHAVGVRVHLDGQRDHVVALDDEETSAGDYRLAGRAATVARDARGRLSRVFMACGTRLSEDGGRTALLEAAQPTTVEAVYGDGTLTLTGQHLQGLRIHAAGVAPDRVTVNGKLGAAGEVGVVLVP